MALPEDKEIRAMKTIIDAMDGLRPEEIKKVLRALSQMFDYKVPR
jgi:hypothetical protein